MSLKIRFRFDGRCSVHPRYNPETDGRPQHKNCAGCESYTSSPYTQLQGKRPTQGTDWLFATRSSGKKNVQLAQQGL